jgi:hypothetical protein
VHSEEVNQVANPQRTANTNPGTWNRARANLAAAISLALVVMFAAPATMRAERPNVPCANPSVFPESAVNGVVLQYTYAGSENRELSMAAKKLSLLIHWEMLFSMLEYGSIGAVQIVVRRSQEPNCTPDMIFDKLTGKTRGAADPVPPGKGMVFLWGILYEEGKDIYLRSYVRFLRRGPSEELSLGAGGKQFRASLSSQSFAFPPRKLTTDDLVSIENQFSSAAILRESPDEKSLSRPLPLNPDSPFPCYISEIKGDWMKLQPFGGEPGGWMKSGFQLGPNSLVRRLPELSLVKALAGYLRYRYALEGDPLPVTSESLSRWASSVEDARQRFETSSQGNVSPVASAVGKQIVGMLKLLAPGKSAADMQAALKLFQEATDQIPYSADAWSLELVTQIYLAYQSAGQDVSLKPREIAEGLTQAAALGPENRTALNNLQQFYELLQTTPPPNPDPKEILKAEDIVRRLDNVEKIRASRANSNPAPR